MLRGSFHSPGIVSNIRLKTHNQKETDMTLKLDNPEMKVYVASMGKIFRVTAIARSDEEANRICERDRNSAVIACDKSGLVYLAEQYGSVCPSAILND